MCRYRRALHCADTGRLGRKARDSRPAEPSLQFRFADDVALWVYLIEDGDAVGNVEFEYLRLVQPVQVHDDGPEAVAVRGDQHVLATLDFGQDFVVEVG